MREFWSDSYDGYYEPFVGSGQLFFDLNVEYGSINDLNSNLINTYKYVRDYPKELSRLTNLLPRGEASYYHIRSLYNEHENFSLTKASYFLFLNRFCFNGLYRTNKKGEFNVPYGHCRTGRLPTESELLKLSRHLSKVNLVSTDFEVFISENLKSNSLYYLDPPFAQKNKEIFTQYTPWDFGMSDLSRVFDCLKSIDEAESKFVFSYAYSEEVMELLSCENYKIETVNVVRNISGFKRKKQAIAKEIIVYN